MGRCLGETPRRGTPVVPRSIAHGASSGGGVEAVIPARRRWRHARCPDCPGGDPGANANARRAPCRSTRCLVELRERRTQAG